MLWKLFDRALRRSLGMPSGPGAFPWERFLRRLSCVFCVNVEVIRWLGDVVFLE